MKTKKASGLFRMQTLWTWILYGALSLLIALMQMSPRCFPEVVFARPTPLVIFVICVAMLEGPEVGAIIGMVSGLLWDLQSFRVFGYYGLILLCFGLIVGLLVQWFLRANFLSAMVLCVGGVIAYTILDWLIRYVLFIEPEMMTVLIKMYLPNALYTVALSPLMYALVLLLARFLRRRKHA